MPSYIWHFVAWWIVLAALPLSWALRAHSPMRRDERVYRLTFLASPLLLGAAWLHGLLLDAWFRPHAMAFYEEQQTKLLTLGSIGLSISLVLAYGGYKAIEHAWNRRTAAISYGLQICAWLLLRTVAAVGVKLDSNVDWLSLSAMMAPLPVIVVIAYLFARQSVEARPAAA